MRKSFSLIPIAAIVIVGSALAQTTPPDSRISQRCTTTGLSPDASGRCPDDVLKDTIPSAAPQVAAPPAGSATGSISAGPPATGTATGNMGAGTPGMASSGTPVPTGASGMGSAAGGVRNLFSISARENTTTRLRESCKNDLRCEPNAQQRRAHLLAQLLKTLLLWQENEAVAEPEHGERRARAQSQILAKLFRNRQLSFFADLGGRQVFEHWIMSCHGW